MPNLGWNGHSLLPFVTGHRGIPSTSKRSLTTGGVGRMIHSTG
jgi:hypothetical protein